MIGQMGRNYFNRKNIVIDCEFLYVAQNPTLLRSRAVAESALDLFDSNEIDEVYIVFNKMINSMSCECETLKILPLERSAFEKKQGEYVHQATFSPSPKAVLQNLVPNYVKGCLLYTSHLFNYYRPDTIYAMGCMLSAGESLNWLKRTFFENISFSELDKLAEASDIGSRGIIFLPYLFGERTPHNDPYARGVFFGLTGAAGKGEMCIRDRSKLHQIRSLPLHA